MKTGLYLLFILAGLTSCSDSDRSDQISYQDTIKLLNLSLGGQQFNDLFKEARIVNRTVHIALDTAGGSWPDHAGKIQIKTINEFQKTPEYNFQAIDSRLIIDPPTFRFNNDSAKVSIYVYIFHLSKEYIFVKNKKTWVLVSHKERQF